MSSIGYQTVHVYHTNAYGQPQISSLLAGINQQLSIAQQQQQQQQLTIPSQLKKKAKEKSDKTKKAAKKGEEWMSTSPYPAAPPPYVQAVGPYPNQFGGQPVYNVLNPAPPYQPSAAHPLPVTSQFVQHSGGSSVTVITHVQRTQPIQPAPMMCYNPYPQAVHPAATYNSPYLPQYPARGPATVSAANPSVPQTHPSTSQPIPTGAGQQQQYQQLARVQLPVPNLVATVPVGGGQTRPIATTPRPEPVSSNIASANGNYELLSELSTPSHYETFRTNKKPNSHSPPTPSTSGADCTLSMTSLYEPLQKCKPPTGNPSPLIAPPTSSTSGSDCIQKYNLVREANQQAAAAVGCRMVDELLVDSDLQVVENSSSTPRKRREFYFVNEQSRKVLQPKRYSNSTGTEVVTCKKLNPVPNYQLWYMDVFGFIHSAMNDFVIDAGNGQKATMRAFNGEPTQRWTVGGKQIVNHATGECLNVIGDAYTDDAEVGSSPHSESQTRNWTLTYI